MTLPSNDLTWMREELERLLEDTCTYYAPESTVTDGVVSEGFASSGTSLDCRMDAKTHTVDQNGAVKFFQRFILTLHHDASVAVGGKITHDGTDYKIVSVDDDKTWRISVRANLELLHG